ncbi:hypothetical protein SDC9_174475 [bioreactor metagenome]|uniref:Uncharacterized protein n=1 Tax=bioreactor metagenome TaxID=1076179 RepID=A0A645GJE2_9ZZZZ
MTVLDVDGSKGADALAGAREAALAELGDIIAGVDAALACDVDDRQRRPLYLVSLKRAVGIFEQRGHFVVSLHAEAESGEDAQADDRALFIDAAAVSCGGTRRNMHEGQLLHALAEVAVLCVTAAGYLPAVYIRPGDAPYYPAFYLYQMI